jgi:REP element-mobilizing transposase RayT
MTSRAEDDVRIGYGKIGRSMPLSIENCGTLGGDVEMASVVLTLAQRNPEHTFVLIGRNDGSRPSDVGLPSNVENPWVEWGPQLLDMKRARQLAPVNNMTIEQHIAMRDLYNELTLEAIIDLDGIVLWSGQHGTTNSPIPSIKDRSKLTKPHDWSEHYCSFLLHGVNAWRGADPQHREEVWLNSDPRNYLKMRDLKWPLRHPVLSQRTYTHNIKHERYGDTEIVGKDWRTLGVTEHLEPGALSGIWRSQVHNVYSRLEINGLVPGSPFGNLISYNDVWDDRDRFGLFTNEARKYVAEAKSRLTALCTWVLPLEPDWIHGTWSIESQESIKRSIKPAAWERYYPLLHSVHSTFAMPSYGNKWATTKAWEAFAAGTVCFMHPEYDDQNNILSDACEELRKWLRVDTVDELNTRVNHLHSQSGKSDWEWLVGAQRAHYDKAMSELTYMKMIEDRLFGSYK